MKIAILVVGLPRTFEYTYQSFFQTLIDPYPEHQFEIFLTTWNVVGNLNREKSIYLNHSQYPEKDWIGYGFELNSEIVRQIGEIYRAQRSVQVLKMDEYLETEKQYIERVLEQWGCQEIDKIIRNSICGQYYAIREAYRDFEKRVGQEGVKSYDLIVKIRFDLRFSLVEKYGQFSWEEIAEEVKSGEIFSLENWRPNGIADQVIFGRGQSFKEYCCLYDHLLDYSREQIEKIKLVSLYCPEIYLNFDGDQDYQERKHEEYLNLIGTWDLNKVMIRTMIPERFLLDYLINRVGCDVKFNLFFKAEVIRLGHVI